MKKVILILTIIISTGAFAMDHSNHTNQAGKNMKNVEKGQMVKCAKCKEMATKNEIDYSQHS